MITILLLLILLVPIRYHGQVKNHDICFCFSISWFFRIIEVVIKREKDTTDKGIYIFWKKRTFKKNAEETQEEKEPDHDRLKALLTEENLKIFKGRLPEIKKIVKRVFPKKIDGYLTFGFEDPYYTGLGLSALSFLVPLFRDDFKVTPLFEGKDQLDFNVNLKGRVYLIAILIPGFIILKDKEFINLIKRL